MKKAQSSSRVAPRQSGRKAGHAAYKIIADNLRADIKRGTYPVGGLLPSEVVLGERFNIGRHTIRDALRILVDDGLLSRRPGGGTTVLAATRQRTFSQTITSFDDWFSYPDDTLRKNLSATYISADEQLSAMIRCPFGAPWFHIRAVRVARGASTPLSLIDIYLLPKLAQIHKLPGHERVPLHQQVEQHCGELIESVEVDILARTASSELCSILSITKDVVTLISTRRFKSSNEEMLLATVSSYPMDRLTCSMRFKRTKL
jgi:DNA-binding GntR family transcriptional regulator